MAQIIQEVITISVARLVKDGEAMIDSAVTDEVLTTLESVVQELVPEGAIVEVENAGTV